MPAVPLLGSVLNMEESATVEIQSTLVVCLLAPQTATSHAQESPRKFAVLAIV